MDGIYATGGAGTSTSITSDHFSNDGYGVFFDGAGTVTVEDNSVLGATSFAYVVGSPTLDLGLLSGNSATGASPIFYLWGHVGTSSTLQPQSASWAVGACAGFDIPAGVTVQVAAGTVMKGDVSVPGLCHGYNTSVPAITVEGTLDAVGTSSSPVVFTSINDPLGGATGSGIPAAGDWGGIDISNAASDMFGWDVFRYADTAISVGKLEILSVEDSVFAYNNKAFDVQGTTAGNPFLGYLDCIPPYGSVVDGTNDWFGSTGVPAPSIDIPSLVGLKIPDAFGHLYGSLTSMISVSNPLFGVGDDTVPWAFFTCPEWGIPPLPPVPVPAVDFSVPGVTLPGVMMQYAEKP